jgi:hypothetical protein
MRSHKGWWEEYGDGLPADSQFIGIEYDASSIAIWHVQLEYKAPAGMNTCGEISG